jgi:hypothetical protein
MNLLQTFGLNLNPKYVFYFFFQNDISDLRRTSNDRIDEFIATPFDSLQFPPIPKDMYTREHIPDNFSLGSEGLAIVKWIRLFQKSIGKKQNTKGKISHFQQLNEIDKFYNFKGKQGIERRKHMDYTLRAIQYMNKICKENGATFVMVPIVHKKYQLLFSELRQLSVKDSIPFINIQPFMVEENRFLPLDMHFSPKGHEDLSEIIVEWINQQEPDL